MTAPKSRCAQCERFTWNTGHATHGCTARYGYWNTGTAYTIACNKFRPKQTPQDQEKKERARHQAWMKLEDHLL